MPYEHNSGYCSVAKSGRRAHVKTRACDRWLIRCGRHLESSLRKSIRVPAVWRRTHTQSAYPLSDLDGIGGFPTKSSSRIAPGDTFTGPSKGRQAVERHAAKRHNHWTAAIPFVVRTGYKQRFLSQSVSP